MSSYNRLRGSSSEHGLFDSNRPMIFMTKWNVALLAFLWNRILRIKMHCHISGRNHPHQQYRTLAEDQGLRAPTTKPRLKVGALPVLERSDDVPARYKSYGASILPRLLSTLISIRTWKRVLLPTNITEFLASYIKKNKLRTKLVIHLKEEKVFQQVSVDESKWNEHGILTLYTCHLIN